MYILEKLNKVDKKNFTYSLSKIFSSLNALKDKF